MAQVNQLQQLQCFPQQRSSSFEPPQLTCVQAVIDLTAAIEADGTQTLYLSNRALRPETAWILLCACGGSGVGVHFESVVAGVMASGNVFLNRGCMTELRRAGGVGNSRKS